MKRMTTLGSSICLAALVAMNAGCGASIVTALSKISSGQICQLSPAEITILNQAAINIGNQQSPPVAIPALTDAQTQAIVDFLQLNQLCTIQEIEGLATRLQQGPPLQGLDALAAAFPNIASTNSNPEAVAGVLHETLGISSAQTDGRGRPNEPEMHHRHK